MEYLRTDTVSVGTLYRKAAKLSRGAGAYFCKHFVPAGAQGGGRLPTLPLRCSQGGLPSLPPAYPAFSLLSFPHPPAPLPGGKGENQGYFMQGASPLASPGAEPQLHWLSLPRGRGPSQTPKFLSPRSPLSLAAGAANREPLPIVFAANRKLPAWGARMAEAVSAAGGSVQGCRGR